MSVSRTAAVIFVGWLLMGAGPALAQEPATSFDQLDRQIRPGDTIVVRSTLGAEVRGRLREVGPSSRWTMRTPSS
jgi:hypothetical protein